MAKKTNRLRKETVGTLVRHFSAAPTVVQTGKLPDTDKGDEDSYFSEYALSTATGGGTTIVEEISNFYTNILYYITNIINNYYGTEPYIGGQGIDITDLVIKVDLFDSGGLEFAGGGHEFTYQLRVWAGAGITLDHSACKGGVSIDLVPDDADEGTGSGLELTGSACNKKLQVKAIEPLVITNDGIELKLGCGLEVDDNDDLVFKLNGTTGNWNGLKCSAEYGVMVVRGDGITTVASTLAGAHDGEVKVARGSRFLVTDDPDCKDSTCGATGPGLGFIQDDPGAEHAHLAVCPEQFLHTTPP